MPIAITVAIGRPSRRQKPDLRTIARAIAHLQIAEGMALHARRDDCPIHAIQAAIVRRRCTSLVPRRLMRDAEWVHRHIEAPGVRIQARLEDQMRADS
jgi:hypothetical protein